MIELYYSAWSIANYLDSNYLGAKDRMELLNRIYIEEHEYLCPEYKNDKKKFYSDVLLWADYLVDQNAINKEFPSIEKDFSASGLSFDAENLMSEFADIDMFFMNLRLRILFSGDKGYVRMKLRTLLSHYGYRRRSALLNEHFRDCLMFYHIQSYLRNNIECDIRDIDLDDMVTFRVL